jgi:hypothetical protein
MQSTAPVNTGFSRTDSNLGAKPRSASTAQCKNVNLCARFTPQGPEEKDRWIFYEFWQDARDEIHKLQKRDLTHRKKKLAKLQAARRKADPIFAKLLRDQMPVEAAKRKFRRAVPNEALAREIVDTWEKAVKLTPEEIARNKDDIARQEKELTHCERIFKARRAIENGLSMLGELASAGDEEAAKDLVQTAVHAAALLGIVERMHPELARNLAKRKKMWPVLATDDADWAEATRRRVADLKLGESFLPFRVRFRAARGTDINLPARMWAKAAVRTIEESRLRILLWGQVRRDFGSTDALVDFLIDHNWQYGKPTTWISEAANMGPFCSDSVRGWKTAIRKMIREEMPDFHTHPDWITQRNTAVASGRSTPGEIQNAILDDIVSALTRLAPAGQC